MKMGRRTNELCAFILRSDPPLMVPLRGMPPSVTRFRIAIYGVLIETSKVLLTTTRVPSGTITNFPGGGLELGEHPKEAVGREFMEETGLQVAVEDLLFCSQLFHQNPEFPDEQLMHIFYRVRRIGGGLTTHGNNDDVASVGWVARSELASKRILPVDQEFVNSPIFLKLLS